MKTFRPLKPGDASISAENINALADEVKRLGKFEASGAVVDSGIGGVHVGVPRRPPAFWAELLSEPFGDGWYSWREVERTALGTFTELVYGRTDDGMLEPAREANNATGVAAGTYVWLQPGWGEPVAGGVNQEWIFRQGGGGGGGFWASVGGGNCTEGRFSLTEVEPQPGGTWRAREGSTIVDYPYAYHVNKGAFPSGGPLVAAGTIVWARAGAVDGDGNQEYVFDCPAGWTGRQRLIAGYRCVDGTPRELPVYIDLWNGQWTRMPCDPPLASPCDTCTPGG